MEFYDNNLSVDYDDDSLYIAFNFKNRFKAGAPTCPVPEKKMSHFDDSLEIQIQVWKILCTILPMLFWFALARVVAQEFLRFTKTNSTLRFLIEFVIVSVPTIFGINVANNSVQYIVAGIIVFLVWLIWKTGCIEKARDRTFFIGTRPHMLTLGRATINFLTAFCILAIDFDTFPKDFRKTREYGAGLMDTGIGLFVFAMASVSKRPRRPSDFKRMLRIVIPLLVLGIARTVVIMAIGYSQDEHEYGTHLNAFFTLGLTKLFGTLVSAIARKDAYLLPLGLVVLAVHEVTLQLGIADFVMNRWVTRDNFLASNREGLCSLPGFVGIYIISIYLGYTWQTTNGALTFKEFMRKMKSMFLLCFAIWLVATICVWTIHIARVTCNFGYSAWVLGIASLMVLLFMFVFDLVLNTLWPIEDVQLLNHSSDGGEGAPLLKETTKSNTTNSKFALPTVVETVNMNGLVFFLVANVLTGCVNMFLIPEDRSNSEGYFILFIYMFLATGLVYLLYRRNIRIA